MSPSQFQSLMNVYLDFHRTYLFRVLFFDGLIGAIQGAFVTNLISNTDTPTSVTNAVNLGWQGSKVKIAGKTEFNDWKVTVRDDSINAAYTYFQNWREKVYKVSSGESSKIDNTGLAETLGIGQGYKKSAIVLLIGNKLHSSSTGALRQDVGALTTGIGAVSMMRAYLISGVWPKDIGTITLDYSTENIATFPVNFSMDYFEPYSLTGLASNLISSLL